MKKLLRIFEHNLVDGFKLRGRVSTSCVCGACAQAKIKRQPQKQHTEFESVAKTVGYLVSSDVKDVSFSSFGGYRYALNFVDHASRLACLLSEVEKRGYAEAEAVPFRHGKTWS